MKSLFAPMIIMSAVLSASSSLAFAAEPARKVVAFNADVRVDVDASGKPVNVEAPADLPEVIRAYIEKRVGAWQYQAAKLNGVAVPATTFVNVGACALPTVAGNGYTFGVDYKGNGASLLSASGRLPPPPYPVDLRRRGAQGVFMVSYIVNHDGSTHVVDVEAPGQSRNSVKLFRPVLTAWIENLRYQPEIVAGKAVETSFSFPVEFRLGNGGASSNWREQQIAKLEARAISSKECIQAAGISDGLMPIAVNSPIKVIPTPAG